MFNGQVPKIPDIPCLYYFMLFLEVIRITDTFSIDYADLYYCLINLLPHPTDFLRTYSRTFL